MSMGEELRHRYPEVLSCVCEAEGRPAPVDAFRVRAMNFGQHWRTPGVVDVTYSIEMPHAYVRDLLDRELREYAADAEQHPDPESDLEQALRANGWPSAGQVLERPELAAPVLAHFAHELLLRWLGDGPPDAHPGFVVNTAEDLRSSDGKVVVRGRARRSGEPAAYQDV